MRTMQETTCKWTYFVEVWLHVREWGIKNAAQETLSRHWRQVRVAVVHDLNNVQNLFHENLLQSCTQRIDAVDSDRPYLPFEDVVIESPVLSLLGIELQTHGSHLIRILPQTVHKFSDFSVHWLNEKRRCRSDLSRKLGHCRWLHHDHA